MTKELKQNLTETVTETELTNPEAVEVEEVEEVQNALMVQREAFKSNGKTYYGYFIAFDMRGHAGKIEMVPATNKGYLNLDIVYGDCSEAPLTVTTTSSKNRDGKRQKFISYSVSTVDEDGFTWVSEIKPASLSDASLLNNLIERIKFNKKNK